jgi:hypothetical protein
MVIAYAEDSESAVDSAHEIVQEKFGHLTTDGLGLFRKGGWVLSPPVLQVSTARFPTHDNRGLEMVNCAMEYNRRAFKENMAHVRDITGIFDEVKGKGWIGEYQIDDNPSPYRSSCGEGACSDFPGQGIHLYDFAGHLVSHPWHLQGILDDSESNPWYVDEDEGRDFYWDCNDMQTYKYQ